MRVKGESFRHPAIRQPLGNNLALRLQEIYVLVAIDIVCPQVGQLEPAPIELLPVDARLLLVRVRARARARARARVRARVRVRVS